MAKYDIDHEQDAVGKSEQEAKRLTSDTDIGEQIYTNNGESERDEVALRASSSSGKADGAEEYDGAHGTERQFVNGEIESGVHTHQDDSKCGEGSPLLWLDLAENPPGAPPDCKGRRRAGDSQPGNAENVNAVEQQNGE